MGDRPAFLAVRRLAITLMAAAALVLALPTSLLTPAEAADNGAWSVSPTPSSENEATPREYFVLEGAPGSVIKDSVRITNFTKDPIDFKIYGADAYNTELGGFFALKSLGEQQEGIGAWTQLPVQDLTVAGRTVADVPIKIRVPDNATPGDHIGGIVAMNAAVEATQEQGNVEIGVQRAVGARVYLRVAGPTTPGIAVSDVKLHHDRGAMPWTGSGAGVVTYTVENTGNVRMNPEVTVKLEGLFGREVFTTVNESVVDLLPGQKATLTQKVDGIGHLDRITTTVSLDTPEGATDEAATTSWLIPWIFLIALAILLIGLVWYLRRRRTALRRGMAEAELAPKIDVPSGV